MSNKVVAHFLDGRLAKGTSFDATPGKPACHLQAAAGTVEVPFDQIKALFFVKDLAGDPSYQEQQAPARGDPRLVGARRIEIEFRDGERLVGLAPSYRADQPLFYVSPIDPKSNNIRILVNRAATVSIRLV